MEMNQTALEDFALKLANMAQPGDCLLLYGALGSGKSTFARAYIRAMTSPQEDVPSPTFTLVQSYPAERFLLWHFDLYRLKDTDELTELALDEALTSGVCLIEWPEKALHRLPEDRLELHLETADDASIRHLVLKGSAGWQERLAPWLTSFPL